MTLKAKQPAFYGSSNKVSTKMDTRSAGVAGKFYGSGFKAKIGKMRTGTGLIEGNPLSKTKLKMPPRSVV